MKEAGKEGEEAGKEGEEAGKDEGKEEGKEEGKVQGKEAEEEEGDGATTDDEHSINELERKYANYGLDTSPVFTTIVDNIQWDMENNRLKRNVQLSTKNSLFSFIEKKSHPPRYMLYVTPPSHPPSPPGPLSPTPTHP